MSIKLWRYLKDLKEPKNIINDLILLKDPIANEIILYLKQGYDIFEILCKFTDNVGKIILESRNILCVNQLGIYHISIYNFHKKILYGSTYPICLLLLTSISILYLKYLNIINYNSIILFIIFLILMILYYLILYIILLRKLQLIIILYVFKFFINQHISFNTLLHIMDLFKFKLNNEDFDHIFLKCTNIIYVPNSIDYIIKEKHEYIDIYINNSNSYFIIILLIGISVIIIYIGLNAFNYIKFSIF